MKNTFKVLATMFALMLAMFVPASAALASGNGSVHSNGGANESCGNYCPTNVGGGDNQGNGNAPANGTVGNADDKNPPGQSPNGSDANNGYECDKNNGVGNNGGNPAHTGCVSASPTVNPSPTKTSSPSPKATPTPKVTKSPSKVKNEKVTICHWANHKYVVITIDKNGLNGHGKHSHDIIPMVKGCPVPVKVHAQGPGLTGGAVLGEHSTLKDRTNLAAGVKSDTSTATLPYTGVDTTIYLAIAMMIVGGGILINNAPELLTGRK